MITLRLFRQSDPFHQLEARSLEQGELMIGRDAEADWSLPDPGRTLSRRHCIIGLNGTALTLRDISANGVLVGQTRERLAPDAIHALKPTETLRLGDYLIVIEAESASTGEPPPAGADGVDAPFVGPVLSASELALADVSVPTDWAADAGVTTIVPKPAAANGDGSLLEAFCEGARLDASAFSEEDPEAVMRRLGAVYQQMVLGLTDLMSERTSVKSQYRMDRTAVRSADNNPFRWAAAQRVAVDLLRARDDGFLSGPAAVQASFSDVKKHLLCMMAGLKSALAGVLEALSPAAVEARISGQTFILKGRGAAAWSEFAALHEQIRREASDDPDSLVSREFRDAYARRLADLDNLSGAA